MSHTDNIPVVSVILPVFNAEKFLGEAIDSILKQTYTGFELIIIDDGSKDGSARIIKSFNDPRIVMVSQENIGLAATLNKGISLAKGRYIARQDNDDISLPQRLEKQLRFLEEHEGVDLLGTAAEIIDEQGRFTGRSHDHSTDPLALKFTLLFNNPFVHSSVMFRKSVIGKTGLYSTDTSVFEDYNLWSRVARVSAVSNLGERLLKYREVNTGMSKSAADYTEKVKRQSVENILFYCPALLRETVRLFVDHHLLLDTFKNSNTAMAFYRSTLDKLAGSFCRHEGIDQGKIRHQLDQEMLNFKRHMYNIIIYSGKSGFFEKAKAKVLRKLMFINNKKHFS